jgi:hypothetical protein
VLSPDQRHDTLPQHGMIVDDQYADHRIPPGDEIATLTLPS